MIRNDWPIAFLLLASLALCVAATLVPVWLLASHYNARDVCLVLGIVGAGAVSLLAAIGYLRWAGYRLR